MATSRLEIALDHGGLVVPPDGYIGALRAVSDADYIPLPQDRLRLSNSFRPEFDRLTARGFDVTPQLADRFSMTLVHITRSKTETLGLVAHAFQMTEPGGVVVVDGAKTDGIDSILKRCKSLLRISDITSKAHGKLFWMTRPDALPDAMQVWLAALEPSPNPAGYLTAPGIFSPDKIDPGSAMLAAHFDARLKGDVADLGAGWGWLTAQALEKGNPDLIDLYEAEETALDVARGNITDSRANFHWADVRAQKIDQRYDSVICNPPFHQGRAADPAIGLDFIAKAADILRPKGMLWLVANRQLPYESSLEQYFGHWKTLEQTPHFKVFLAEKPRSASARLRLSQRTPGARP